MIALQQLSKTFGDRTAVNALTLSVEKGEIFGFLGPNGAGKSTTVKMLTGMIFPSSGSARVAGYDIAEEPIEVKKRIGYVPESGAIFESLTASEYLQLIGELHHLDPVLTERRSNEFLALFGLMEHQHQRIQQYSKGMKQKVLIAAALIHNPDVLFLDEPLNGLDANASLVFKELLKKLSAQGKTIFFTSHILDVVERICTRIAIINNGTILIDGTATEILQKTGERTLEDAFAKLTGVGDAKESAQDFMDVLGKE